MHCICNAYLLQYNHNIAEVVNVEHSIEAYFNRRSTEELERLLYTYCDEKEPLYRYYAELIKEILEKRMKSSKANRFNAL